MNDDPLVLPPLPAPDDDNEHVDIDIPIENADYVSNQFQTLDKISRVSRNLESDFTEVANTLPQFTQIRDKNFHLSSEEPPNAANIENENSSTSDDDSETITFKDQRQPPRGGKAPYSRNSMADTAVEDEKMDDDEEVDKLPPGFGYVRDARNIKVVHNEMYIECKFIDNNNIPSWVWFKESEIRHTAADLVRVCKILYYNKYNKVYPKNKSAYRLHDKFYPPDNTVQLGFNSEPKTKRQRILK